MDKKLVLKRPLTITVSNGKGGVGKTTISRFLPYELAQRGYKTLVIDEDPQANVTKTMIITKEKNESGEVFVLEKTLMAGVRDNDIAQLITPVMPNLDVIPSHIDFKGLDNFLSKKYGVAEKVDNNYYEVEKNKVYFMRKLIEPFKENYDFIFIDTPPTAGVHVRSATAASDYVIIAFQTQSDSLDGALQFINQDMNELVNDFSVPTDVIGVLANQLDAKGAIDQQVLNDAKRIFGEENMFKFIIPFAKRIQSAPRSGITRDGYWDKKLFNDVVEPLTDDFLERVKLVEDL